MMWSDHGFLISLFVSVQIFCTLRSANAEYNIVPDLEHSLRESEAENELRRNAYDIDDVAERIFPKRNMDPIDRSGFSSFVKKNMDPIDRSGFSDFAKKNMDPIDRSGFNTFIKRKLQEGFKQMIRNSKKNMDPIDRSGFSDLSKRMPRSASSGCLYSCNFK